LVLGIDCSLADHDKIKKIKADYFNSKNYILCVPEERKKKMAKIVATD
jgi:hypothetical protein